MQAYHKIADLNLTQQAAYLTVLIIKIKVTLSAKSSLILGENFAERVTTSPYTGLPL